MGYTIRIGGTWLRAVGPYADVSVSHAWSHGSDQVSWRMPATLRHPTLERGGALVEAFLGGIRIWHGRLAEPAAAGQYVANGTWSQAANVYALDGSGNATNVPDTAIDAAIARGALTWTRPASISSAAWGTASEPMKLLQLLDEAMAGQSKRWWVDEDGAVRAAADPTTPTYVVPRAAVGHGLTLAEDDYYSHLVGTYLATGPVYATVTVGDAAAAIRWGRREAQVDLTDMGIISSGTATAELNGRLALTGARMGFAESLQLEYGQITTPGGTPVPIEHVLAATRSGGLMVRLMGVTDNSRPAGNLPYTDIVVAHSSCTAGGTAVELRPTGLAARNLEDVLTKGAAA